MAGEADSEKEATRKRERYQTSQVCVVSVSGMVTLADCLFSRALKEKINMWFPLGSKK